MDIDFRCLSILNIIAESNVMINEKEAKFLMNYAKKNGCRICKEKVKMIASASGLTIFENDAE